MRLDPVLMRMARWVHQPCFDCIAELEAEVERLEELLTDCTASEIFWRREAQEGGGRESGPAGDTKPSRVDTGKAAANPAAPFNVECWRCGAGPGPETYCWWLPHGRFHKERWAAARKEAAANPAAQLKDENERLAVRVNGLIRRYNLGEFEMREDVGARKERDG